MTTQSPEMAKVKRLVIWLIAVIIMADIIHVATIWAIPRVIMSRVMTVVAGNSEANVMAHMQRPDETSRTVVRPSPDLAYSICSLDLSKGAVHVVVPLSAPYSSVALYSSATDNYFVRNDRDTDGAPVDIVVVGKREPIPSNLPPSTTLIESPTDKGLVLVRRVIENDESFPALDEMRRTASCSTIKG